MTRPQAALAALLATGAAALAAAPAAGAATREFWVAATPVVWNMAPNQRDNITGARLEPAQTVMPTTVYRRYSRGWRRPLPTPRCPATRTSSRGR